MKSWKRIAVFTVVLSALAGGATVAAVTTGAEDASALPCCERSCDWGYDRCVNACDGDFECEDFCWDRWDTCYANCSPSC